MAYKHHEPWDLTAEQRAEYRRTSVASRLAKERALNGDGPPPIHPINRPRYRPLDSMPQQPANGFRALSLFSGGGGLDLGFDRAGYQHVASYEILEEAGATLRTARPAWDIRSGVDGDATTIKWGSHRGRVDVIHGGAPCQPFSAAGRQRGPDDERDLFPVLVKAILAIRPMAFVAENVPALTSAKFADYVRSTIIAPLEQYYTIRRFVLSAEAFGVPQLRRRVFFAGFRSAQAAERFRPPEPTHGPCGGLVAPACPGVRWALGLPDIGYDALAPTMRSSLTGPRHTTSVVSSVSALRAWERLQIWPNGVALDRRRARAFVAKNAHFRLSVPDCALIQGFPEDWPFQGATYMALGQIGNAVAPPMAYSVACALSSALRNAS